MQGLEWDLLNILYILDWLSYSILWFHFDEASLPDGFFFSYAEHLIFAINKNWHIEACLFLPLLQVTMFTNISSLTLVCIVLVYCTLLVANPYFGPIHSFIHSYHTVPIRSVEDVLVSVGPMLLDIF